MKLTTVSKMFWVLVISLFVALCFDFAQGRVLQRPIQNKAAPTQAVKKPVLKRFSWIHSKDGKKIGGMGMPASAGDIKLLAEKGVGLVVTLTQEALPLSFFSDKQGIKNLHLPISNMGVPTFAQVDQFLEAAARIHQEKKGVIVHCQAGIGRTGTLLACWMIANEKEMTHPGMTAQDVIKALRKRRSPSISSKAQKNFIHAYFKRYTTTQRLA